MCVLAEGFSMPWVVETVTALAPGWESELKPCGFGHCTFQRCTHDCNWCQNCVQRCTPRKIIDVSAWIQDSKRDANEYNRRPASHQHIQREKHILARIQRYGCSKQIQWHKMPMLSNIPLPFRRVDVRGDHGPGDNSFLPLG